MRKATEVPGPRPRTPLGPGGEFDRIRAFLREVPDPGPECLVGPGDDAAVLEGGFVLSSDLFLEEVHFRREWISMEEAGYRAAMAALSDLAAMGAAPLGLLASVAVPAASTGEEDLAGSLMAGIREAAGEVGTSLLGGDLSRSPGPVVVDVVVVGRTDEPLLRSGAEPGDELWVTGVLGGAAGAAALWEAGRPPPEPLRAAFTRPTPRIAQARWLVKAGARAGLDLSDGLAGDAGHLAAASGVCVRLEADALPLHPALASAGLPPGADPLALALHGGEDYELLVAAAPGVLGPRLADFSRTFGLALTRVGRTREGEGVELVPAGGGRPEPVARGGFDHFRREAGS